MAGLGIYGELLGAQLENLASDANFVVAGANPTGIAPPGLIYFSSATKLPRWHTGTAWVSGVDDVTAQDISNKTFISGTTFLKNATGTNRKIGFDLGAATDSTTATLTFIQSANAAYTFPPASGTLSTLAGTESLLNKTISSTSALTGALTLPVGTTTNRDGLTTTGMVRFNTTDSSFEGYDGGAWSSIGGAGVKDRVTQTGHGFSLGNILYLSGGTYVRAKADAANTAEVVGMVSRVVDANTFEITLSGEVVGLSGLTAGEMYFLSAATAGAITTTEPSVIGQVSLPVGVANSTTSMYVQPKRGILIGATNVRTNLPLSNNSTSPVQNVSSYDAGKLSGWISISATTPLRFYVEASFSKSGAGSDYFLSYRTSGDNPPVGFSLTITSSGIIQCVMPSVTGFVSASINYGLNVAAVGTALPLSVSARGVLGDTSGTAVPAGCIGELLKAQVLRASAVSCTTLTERTVTTLTLTAGVWDVSGSCAFSLGAGASATYQVCGINTAASIDFDKGRFGISAAITATASTSSYAISTQRVLVTSTEVVYLRCDQAFSGGTCTAYGIINAVRIA